MDTKDTIYLAGHRGLVGSAVHRKLKSMGHRDNLVTAASYEMDLRDNAAVQSFFDEHQPRYVLLAAAMVGGIGANSASPAQFINDNLLIQTNVINAALNGGVEKFLFLGSSCIYPRLATQPMTEDQLLAGPLEPTNEAYAVAKIAGITMCQAYAKEYGFNAISLMPTNLYGPGDNFDLESSHVVPALMRKFHEAKIRGDSEVTIWGTGTPLREFLHVDDLADACCFLMDNYDSPEIINVGSGKEVSIYELAQKIKRVVGFQGDVVMDTDKPDGTPRKLLDNTRLTGLGWSPKIALDYGLRQTYKWVLGADEVRGWPKGESR